MTTNQVMVKIYSYLADATEDWSHGNITEAERIEKRKAFLEHILIQLLDYEYVLGDDAVDDLWAMICWSKANGYIEEHGDSWMAAEVLHDLNDFRTKFFVPRSKGYAKEYPIR